VPRLIFSRKGFDSGWGGKPSPILPDGKLISLPIPDPGSELTYDDCFAANGDTFASLLRRLGIDHVRVPTGGGRTERIALADKPGCHLDPDLDRAAMPRRESWRPAFGQVGASQTHLANHGVGPGDVFLFFGWFCPVRDEGDRLRYLGRAQQVQALWGWMEIGDVVALDVESPPPWASAHPHVASRHLSRYQRNNTLYLAAVASTAFPGAAGAGRFRWSDATRLTRHGSTPSVWELPGCFHPASSTSRLSHHGDSAWDLIEGRAVLRSARIGQEFVINMTDDMHAWTQALIGRTVTP